MPFFTTRKDRKVYKKAYTGGNGQALVTLIIPKGTRYFKCTEKRSLWSDGDYMKCRAPLARVVSVREIETNRLWNKVGKVIYGAHSRHYVRQTYVIRSTGSLIIRNLRVRYIKGRTVRPTLAFSQGEEACASGIHFFESKQRALNY